MTASEMTLKRIGFECASDVRAALRRNGCYIAGTDSKDQQDVIEFIEREQRGMS